MKCNKIKPLFIVFLVLIFMVSCSSNNNQKTIIAPPDAKNYGLLNRSKNRIPGVEYTTSDSFCLYVAFTAPLMAGGGAIMGPIGWIGVAFAVAYGVYLIGYNLYTPSREPSLNEKPQPKQ